MRNTEETSLLAALPCTRGGASRFKQSCFGLRTSGPPSTESGGGYAMGKGPCWEREPWQSAPPNLFGPSDGMDNSLCD